MLELHQACRRRSEPLQVWLCVLPEAPACRDSWLLVWLLCWATEQASEGEPSSLEKQLVAHLTP